VIRDIEGAAAWLEGLLNVEKRPDWPYARFGLDPVRRLLGLLGDPHEGLAVVHVAGSKDKGSTVLLLEALLRAASLRVGTYTSPHLERWTERVRLDGRETDGARLAAALETVRPHVESLRSEDPKQAPTFFDALTAAALVCFRQAGVDCALLEVGLGGRLDSTNVVVPRVSCITSIELEHTDRLGGTLAEIAFEKAGVVKPGVPLVAGDLPEEAREVVEERARLCGAPVAWAGRDFRSRVLEAGPDGQRVHFVDGDLELETRLPLLGPHQAGNAALALACARRAGGLVGAGLAEAARSGWSRVELPGRLEVLGRSPLVLVDAAHTAASARALAEVLRALSSRPVHLVLSVSAGKQLAAILAALLPCADEVTVTRAEPARSLAPAEVAAAVRAAAPGLPLRVVPNPHLALRAAVDGIGASGCLCVGGSMYLAGIARSVLRRPGAPPGADDADAGSGLARR
jgi:dihydrofolate synthase/folylpolyglutamate synthase